MAIQETVMTRHGTDRIMRYAFDLCRRVGKGKVTSATKSNGIIHTMPFWDERFEAIAAEYPDLKTDKYHIDILNAHRSEERRGGKEWVSTCQYRWLPYHSKKKTNAKNHHA